MYRKRLSVFAVAALTASSLIATTAASAAPPERDEPRTGVSDNRVHPLSQEQNERREKALESVLAGKIDRQAVAEVAKGQFVELERAGEESIWTVLGEFADYQHNTIPEPDRSVDNTTYWVDDFSEDHFQKLLFAEDQTSMRDIYIELSSNRYTVNGDVTDWIGVSGDAADYGANDVEEAGGTWTFIKDTVDGWWADALADMAPDEANEYLSQFDQWDRYDHDGDGNFDEPDGYIDHFQAVHSGEGEEAGGGELGGDAIWSHRWYVQLTQIGTGGPSVDGEVNPLGGTQIGDSDYWIGDYTVEPENGGVGVFAHEYAHDLGLPDLYDTTGGENGTGFWTLMSSGSWLGEGGDHIGTKPGHMGAWEKFQLGWLDYEVSFQGEKSQHKLGPATATTKQAQALFTVLEPKEVTEVVGEPHTGENFYYSGQGNNLDHVMYKQVTLPAGAELTAQVDYQIEEDWDYAYVVVSTDGGATWNSVPTDHSDEAGNPNGQDFGYGISGATDGWESLTADLSVYEGDVLVGFRYWTDVAAIERGLSVDEIAIAGGPTDGAEGDPTFTLDGFTVTTGTSTALYNQYYVSEFRSYRGYDETLATGPYNFGFPDTASDWVEHFPYQDGLLISYWDTSQADNNIASHPGQGMILPIDAHPAAMYDANGDVWRSRIQTYDATFGLEDTDAITLHTLGEPSHHESLPAESVFDDTNTYYDTDAPYNSVIHPNTGTQIRVKSVSARGNFAQVEVRPSK